MSDSQNSKEVANTAAANPNKQPAHLVQQVRREMISSGPLPSPEILKRYEEILPGAAERIVQMAEREQSQSHIHMHEQLRIEGSINTEHIHYMKRGQVFAFILALVFVSLATVLAILGHEIAASALGGSTILGIVSVYLSGGRQSS